MAFISQVCLRDPPTLLAIRLDLFRPLLDSNLNLLEVPVLLQQVFEFLTLGCCFVNDVNGPKCLNTCMHTIYGDVSQRTASFRFVQLQDLFRSCAFLLASRITVSTHLDHGIISDQL